MVDEPSGPIYVFGTHLMCIGNECFKKLRKTGYSLLAKLWFLSEDISKHRVSRAVEQLQRNLIRAKEDLPHGLVLRTSALDIPTPNHLQVH